MADVKGTFIRRLLLTPHLTNNASRAVRNRVKVEIECPFLRLSGLNDNLTGSLIQSSYLASSRPCPAPVSKRLVSRDGLLVRAQRVRSTTSLSDLQLCESFCRHEMALSMIRDHLTKRCLRVIQSYPMQQATARAF